MKEAFDIPKEFKVIRYIYALSFDITQPEKEQHERFRVAYPHFIETQYIMEDDQQTKPIIHSLN
jgi:hypothetical protein